MLSAKAGEWRPADPTIGVRDLPDQLAGHIVTLLAIGEPRPGQRLREVELCERLGVSRVPLREALRLFRAQGVVRTEPNRGTFLVELGSDDMAEMLEVPIGVERAAIRRLLGDRDADLAPLHDAVKAMRAAARLGDVMATCRADLRFHGALVALSGSAVLGPIWASLSRGVLVFLVGELSGDFDTASWIADHERLLGMIEARDAEAAHREIEAHVLNGAEPAR